MADVDETLTEYCRGTQSSKSELAESGVGFGVGIFGNQAEKYVA